MAVPLPTVSILPGSPLFSETAESARGREVALSRVLMAYIGSGLVFMLLPGTFLGVWNLLRISGTESAVSVSPAWLQAHGHAQVFGWIGSFILGIGFYSIPKLRGVRGTSLSAAWACWVAWSAGVGLRWTANVYGWEWRVLLPVSAILELAAFLVFFRAVSRHRPSDSGRAKLEPWVFVVIAASFGFLSTLGISLGATIALARGSGGPALSHIPDQRFLTLITWGFLVPFVWGFSSKWMPVFLGLGPVRWLPLFAALAMNLAGIVLTFLGWANRATALFVIAAVLVIVALRMLEPAQHSPKIQGVHPSFPHFVRMAYLWLLVAALLGVAAALRDSSGGIWGASRHALTVGFIATMVLCVGQRVLPAFAGMRRLWSARLMFAALAFLSTGCVLRVAAEVLAYQGYAAWAWTVLPVSGVLELTGITAFAANLAATFVTQRGHPQKLAATAR